MTSRKRGRWKRVAGITKRTRRSEGSSGGVPARTARVRADGQVRRNELVGDEQAHGVPEELFLPSRAAMTSLQVSGAGSSRMSKVGARGSHVFRRSTRDRSARSTVCPMRPASHGIDAARAHGATLPNLLKLWSHRSCASANARSFAFQSASSVSATMRLSPAEIHDVLPLLGHERF
jgi:hypothetical protein